MSFFFFFKFSKKKSTHHPVGVQAWVTITGCSHRTASDGSTLWARTQSSSSRKCGTLQVNEHFHVEKAALTAGGRPLRQSEGFSMFLMTLRILFNSYLAGTRCHQDIVTVLAVTFFPVLIRVFFFFSIVYCLCELWNISTRCRDDISFWLSERLFLNPM